MKKYHINKLINKITKNNQSLNCSFKYFGYNVILKSGSTDFVHVNVTNNNDKVILDFEFDFMLSVLSINSTETTNQIGWLYTAIRRYYPNLRFLIENAN